MDTSLSEEIAEKSRSAKSTAEPETGDQTEQDDPKLPAKAEHRAERIKSSVARLTSSSINELEGLTSELSALQEFLKSETDRMQREVESALAGLIPILTLSNPWLPSRGVRWT
jgi:predicted RNase H-like nuclease (RuvC/YqgF family)